MQFYQMRIVQSLYTVDGLRPDSTAYFSTEIHNLRLYALLDDESSSLLISLNLLKLGQIFRV